MARRRGPDRPTILDVADLAGVSRQTVSRVIANHPSVAPETRRRVEQAIEQLGYRPNRMARALVTRRSRTFGIASVDMRNQLFSDTCSAMQEAAREHGYSLVVAELDRRDDRGMGTLETLVSLGVDGIAVFPSILADEDVAAFAGRFGGPVVMITRAARIPNVISIALDEWEAARKLVGHLHARGRRRIGLLMNEMFPDVVHDRYLALREAIAAATGVTEPPVVADRPTIPRGQVAAATLLDRHPDTDAIVAFNDMMAMGALKACKDLGLDVPRDVAVAGYDGIPFGEVVDPPLTTVVQDAFGMAREAYHALYAGIHGQWPADGEVRLWEPELVIRGST